MRTSNYPGPNEEGHLTGADGVRLFYRKLGNGKDVVVILHGGPGGTMNRSMQRS